MNVTVEFAAVVRHSGIYQSFLQSTIPLPAGPSFSLLFLHTPVLPSVCYSYTHQSFLQSAISLPTGPFFSLLFLHTPVLPSVCYSYTHQSFLQSAISLPTGPSFNLLFPDIPVLIQSAIPIPTSPYSVYYSLTYQSLFSLLVPCTL